MTLDYEVCLAIGGALVDEFATLLNEGKFKFSSFIRKMVQNIVVLFIFKAIKKRLTKMIEMFFVDCLDVAIQKISN